MSKTQAKRRGKNKTKSQPPKETVRTDVWQLGTTPTQKEQMLLTVQEYRAYLRPLVLLINAQWTQLCSLSANERVNMVEKMIHATAKNPTPKHYYYHQVAQKRPSFRKFPSYLNGTAPIGSGLQKSQLKPMG